MKTWLLLLMLLAGSAGASAQTAVPLWHTLPAPPPMPRADQSGLAPVNHIPLYYAVFNKKGSHPVILLHGGFASSDEWGFEVPLLMKTHQVIVVDSRGHGRSSAGSEPLSYDLMTADVLGLMNYLKLSKASIVGWSDGGIIGLIMAIRHPERIDKLFTFGTNYNLLGYRDEPADTTLAARFMARAQANYQKLSPTPGNFAVLKKSLGKMYSIEPSLTPAELRTIKAPTVVACGRYEQFIKPEHFEEMARLIPQAKLVVLPNVAHGGPLQDPAAFHQAVINLLDHTP